MVLHIWFLFMNHYQLAVMILKQPELNYKVSFFFFSYNFNKLYFIGRGSLPFPFMNARKGDWKCNELKQICEDNDRPEHGSIAFALKKMIFEAMKKTDSFISSRDLDVFK